MGQKHRLYHPLRVRYNETDAQGHVFFDIGLLEYARAIRYAYAGAVASGVDMFYVEANCQYRSRVYFGDLLHIRAGIGHTGKTSFTFESAIHKQPGDDLIAMGKIVAVTVDAETEQPGRAPDGLREAVAPFEGEPGNSQ